MPAPLHRLVLRVGHAVRLRWWRMMRPEIAGICVIGCDDQGRILLVRHSYGSGRWALPSGALGRREDPACAARREMKEETACELADLKAHGIYTHILSGARNSVHVFAGRVEQAVHPDGREVIEARFFAINALPAQLDRHVEHLLALLEQGSQPSKER